MPAIPKPEEMVDSLTKELDCADANIRLRDKIIALVIFFNINI